MLVRVARWLVRLVNGVGVITGWRVRCLRLGEVCSGLGLLAHDEFGGDRGVDVLVQLEADAAAAGSVEDLYWDLALCLGGIVQIDDGVYAFHDLALQHRLAREPGVEVHDVGLEPLVMEGSLDPADKVSRDLLEKEDLDVGNVRAEPAG
jgi:hypothetical protein